MRNRGIKIIGYISNGYMAEKLVHACGVVPLAISRGGDDSSVSATTSNLGRFLEVTARVLGIKLEDMGSISSTSKNICKKVP